MEKMYQANYFSEKKTINAKFTLPDGVSQSKDFIVDTNFVVFLKKEVCKLVKEYFNDYMNERIESCLRTLRKENTEYNIII